MKKLFYIANIALPSDRAHGIQITKTCEALSKMSVEVELAVNSRRTPIKEDVFTYYGVKDNFKVKKLWCLDTVHIGWFGFWIAMLTFASSVIYHVSNSRGLFFTRDEFIACVLKLLGKEVVWEAHTGQRNIFVKLLTKTGTKIVAISNGVKDHCLEMGAQDKNVVVIPDGVDLEEFDINVKKEEVRLQLGVEPDSGLVIYTGSLYKWKGWRTLEEAKRFLPTNVEIKIVSNKPYREIPSILKVADVLILPNSAQDKLASVYTSPMKLFEYMASKRPIVASNVASLKEILDDSMAYFFEPDNSESLARGIEYALSHKEESDQKALSAFSKVKEYTWENRAKKILEFINL